MILSTTNYQLRSLTTYFILALFFAIPSIAQVPGETCGTPPTLGVVPLASATCIAPEIALDETARANLPDVIVPYVFHYIQYNDDGVTCSISGYPPPPPGTRFEMTCSSGGNYNAPANVIRHVADFQTQFDYLFENLSEYDHVDSALPQPYAAVLGDSRIRMVPEATSAQPGALHCPDVPGVYIWNSLADLNASGLLSNSRVQAIIVYGDYYSSVCSAGGRAGGGNVYLYAHLTSDPVKIKQNIAYTVLHEIVHLAGLGHAFDQSGCTQVDLGGPSPYYSGVVSSSNNVMDYHWPGVYTGRPYAGSLPNVSLSACQWSNLYCERANRFSTAICEKQNGVDQISGIETIGDINGPIPLTINKNIEVLAGADLTFTGVIKFAPDVAIVVRRGARLTIDNAVLSSCNPTEEGRWEGIFIEGNYDLEQPEENTFPAPSEAGVVRVYTSNISGSSSVLRTYRFEPATDGVAGWDRSYWGGVMYVRDSEFSNNKRVAEFMKYEIKNKSLFHGTVFNGEQGVTRSDRAITAWATHGIQVDEGCTFYDYSDEAIFSINAFFEINNSAFRYNHESIVLEYTRSHLSSEFVNLIGEKGTNELSNNFGAIAIVSSDYQFSNRSVVVNNFVSNSENYYVETYGMGRINIDNNSFSGTTGDAFIWSVHPSLLGSIDCNVLSGAGLKNRGLAISGDQTETSVEGNVLSGLNSGLLFRDARDLFFYPKSTQGSSNVSHGNYWTGNAYDVLRDNSRRVRNHAEMTFFSHTFLQGQSSNFNPNESVTYGGIQRVVMERAFDEHACTDHLEVVEPGPPTDSPCEQFAGGGLSPDLPQQKANLASLYDLLEEAYAAVPIDGSPLVDLVDCLTEEDQIRLYYLSLNFTHDENLYQAVKNSESLTYSDISGLERARQVWLFENGMLADEPILDYYEVTCVDSKLAMPYLREHNFVMHRKVSSPDYLSCTDREDEGEDMGLDVEQETADPLVDHHNCETSCKGVTYSVVDLLSGEEQPVPSPSKVDKFDFDKPYRFLKVVCPDHGAHLTRKIE